MRMNIRLAESEHWVGLEFIMVLVARW